MSIIANAINKALNSLHGTGNKTVTTYRNVWMENAIAERRKDVANAEVALAEACNAFPSINDWIVSKTNKDRAKIVKVHPLVKNIVCINGGEVYLDENLDVLYGDRNAVHTYGKISNKNVSDYVESNLYNSYVRVPISQSFVYRKDLTMDPETVIPVSMETKMANRHLTAKYTNLWIDPCTKNILAAKTLDDVRNYNLWVKDWGVEADTTVEEGLDISKFAYVMYSTIRTFDEWPQARLAKLLIDNRTKALQDAKHNLNRLIEGK